MKQIQSELWKRERSKAHLVPVGGSDSTGLWGYLKGFEEMLEQGWCTTNVRRRMLGLAMGRVCVPVVIVIVGRGV